MIYCMEGYWNFLKFTQFCTMMIINQLIIQDNNMIHSHEATSLCDIKYKIVFLGDMSVGKSSIIESFINGQFDDSHQHTVGIDFLAKNVTYREHMYRLQLWDTAGQEKFKSLIPAYLRDAHCAVLVYDIASRRSFESIQGWIQMFNDYRRSDAIMLLVGNKTDLKQQREVSQQMGFELATKKQIGYCEVSAKKGQKIDLLFESIIENIQIHKNNQEGEEGIGGSEEIIAGQSQTQRKINKEAVVKVATLKKSRIPCCSI